MNTNNDIIGVYSVKDLIRKQETGLIIQATINYKIKNEEVEFSENIIYFFNKDSNSDFIEFEDVTEKNVISWYIEKENNTARLNMENYVLKEYKKLNKQKENPILVEGVPSNWK